MNKNPRKLFRDEGIMARYSYDIPRQATYNNSHIVVLYFPFRDRIPCEVQEVQRDAVKYVVRDWVKIKGIRLDTLAVFGRLAYPAMTNTLRDRFFNLLCVNSGSRTTNLRLKR